jgi:hypothetical protein
MNDRLSLLPKIIVLFLYMTSCKNEKLNPEKVVIGYEFFPLQTGQWREYKVDSIVHLDSDDIYEIDTAIRHYTYHIREVVDTPFFDAQQEQAFVILRYKRMHDSLPWDFNSLWTAKLTPHSAQRVEENIRFVRLEFPVRSNATWNGNAFNFFPVEEYRYENLFEPGSWGALSFDSTVTVLQNEFITSVNRTFKVEKYAAGAGLVFKQLDSVRTTNTPHGTIILNGLEYQQVITDYEN